jgi:hypothetical protein
MFYRKLVFVRQADVKVDKSCASHKVVFRYEKFSINPKMLIYSSRHPDINFKQNTWMGKIESMWGVKNAKF